MSIHDSDPERRNFMLTSVAFLLFYFADGRVNAGPITMQVIPITFNNVKMLEIFAWVMFLWFALRYWQTHRRSYQDAFFKHLNEFGNANELGAWYIEKTKNISRFREKEPGFNGFMLQWVGINKTLYITYSVVESFTKNEDGSYSVHRERNSGPEKLSGWYGTFVMFKYHWSFIVKSPGFTSYAVPYILFYSVLVVFAIDKYKQC